MLMDWSDKVVLITGASSGIGATYADRLARRGYDLILVARDQQRLDRLATRLSGETSAQVATLQADLTSKADLARVVAASRKLSTASRRVAKVHR